VFLGGLRELVLLKQLLHLLLLLGYIHSFLVSASDAVGLSDLPDLKDDHQELL
jgi:RING-H2 zinc finger protein RHA1